MPGLFLVFALACTSNEELAVDTVTAYHRGDVACDGCLYWEPASGSTGSACAP